MRATSAKAGRRRAPSRATSGPVGLTGAPGNGPKPVMRTESITRRSPARSPPPRSPATAAPQPRPLPLDLLLAPLRVELARFRQARAVGEHLLPQRVDAGAGQRRIGDHRRRPVGR